MGPEVQSQVGLKVGSKSWVTRVGPRLGIVTSLRSNVESQGWVPIMGLKIKSFSMEVTILLLCHCLLGEFCLFVGLLSIFHLYIEWVMLICIKCDFSKS